MSKMFSSWFGGQPTMKLTFENQESLPTVRITRDDGSEDSLILFNAEEPIAGTVEVIVPGGGKKIEHHGIKAELIGQIELAFDRGNHYVFMSSIQELAPAGFLSKDTNYRFAFPGTGKDKEAGAAVSSSESGTAAAASSSSSSTTAVIPATVGSVDKPYESYYGNMNVVLRYFVRVRISRGYSSAITKEFDFAVQKVQPAPETNSTLKMEVGIEDCLHIEFEYDKSRYHLKDVILGKIYFLLVRIKIKHMEIQILKRETSGVSPNEYNETKVITKYEIMDGAPIKGENIPVRLFLEPYELTPTFNTVHSRFSVRYFVNLVLIDEEERRYFKQQEIQLWRRDLSSTADPFIKAMLA